MLAELSATQYSPWSTRCCYPKASSPPLSQLYMRLAYGYGMNLGMSRTELNLPMLVLSSAVGSIFYLGACSRADLQISNSRKGLE